MQTLIQPAPIEIYEGTTAVLVAAVYNEATGIMLTSAQVDSVNINVFPIAGGGEPSTAIANIGPLLGTETFSDTAVINNWATLLGSDEGYNFAYLLGPGEAPLLGGYSYRAEVLISLGLDLEILIPYIIIVKARWSP